MKKVIRKLTASLLFAVMITVVIVLSLPGSNASAERTIFDVENELKQYQNMLAKVRSELSQIKSDISSLEKKSGENEKLLEGYQAEIEALEAEIEINNAMMDSFDRKRADVAAEIALTNESYDYHIEMYKNLIQFIYENSSVNTFELLFTSDNISDYLSKRDNFNDIMDAVNDLVKSVKSDLADLELLQDEYSETQQQYENYISELKKTELDYQSKVKKFEEIAADLGMNVEDLRAQYAGKNSSVTELNAKIKALTKEREEMYAAMKSDYKWPLASNVSYRVTSYFGYRNDPFGKPTTEFHKGLDIACAQYSHIIASRGGTVTKAEYYGGYGNCVIVYHGNGISTLYAHMTKIGEGIKAGVVVKQGDLLGYVGTTGRSTGYHLHFGVINTNQHDPLGTQYDNPDKYLPNGFYTKKLKSK